MARGLDHIVHAVRDLDAAAEFYRRMGFTVGARNRHPWGTHNHLVQFPGFFVEILTLGEPDKLGDDGFSELFGRFNRDFIARHEGLSLLILESKSAKADEDAFRKADIAGSQVMRFEREGRTPEGAPVKVAFSLAFAREETSSEAGFAVCEQHYPENFWNPAFQDHTNSVTGIASVVLVAENPSDHHIFLSVFSGERELHSSSSGVWVRTPRGDIRILHPQAFRQHFGVEPAQAGRGLRIAGICFRASDLHATQTALAESGCAFVMHMDRLVVAPETAMGAAIVFESGAAR